MHGFSATSNLWTSADSQLLILCLMIWLHHSWGFSYLTNPVPTLKIAPLELSESYLPSKTSKMWNSSVQPAPSVFSRSLQKCDPVCKGYVGRPYPPMVARRWLSQKTMPHPLFRMGLLVGLLMSLHTSVSVSNTWRQLYQNFSSKPPNEYNNFECAAHAPVYSAPGGIPIVCCSCQASR